MGLETNERPSVSEGCESEHEMKFEPQYESEPTSEVTYREYLKFPGDDQEELSDMETDEDGRKFITRVVKLNDDQFAEFLLQDKLQRKKIKKQMKRKALVKRLKKQNNDLKRQVKKDSFRRRLMSSDEDDNDKTLELQQEAPVNNNDDVIKDIDRFLESDSGQETVPVVRTPAWLGDAENLDDEEKQVLLERLRKELDPLVPGIALITIEHLCHLLWGCLMGILLQDKVPADLQLQQLHDLAKRMTKKVENLHKKDVESNKVTTQDFTKVILTKIRRSIKGSQKQGDISNVDSNYGEEIPVFITRNSYLI